MPSSARIHYRSPSPAGPASAADGADQAEASDNRNPASKRQKRVDDNATTGSKASAAVYTDKSQKAHLLDRIKNHTYQSPLSNPSVHGGNVERVHAQIEAFVDALLIERPHATASEVRQAISKKTADFVLAAQFDPSCYETKGSQANEYGKHLIFSSTTIPYFKDDPEWRLAAQGFRFKPGEEILTSHALTLRERGQVTPIHDHPDGRNNGANDNKPTQVLVECASFVVQGRVNERSYTLGENGRIEKLGKDHRDAGSWRIVDNHGDPKDHNHPHSIKNIGDTDAFTWHFYTMDGVSADQQIAVQDVYRSSKTASPTVHRAYDDFIERLKAGQTGGAVIAEISSDELHAAMTSSTYHIGGKEPLLLDVREPVELLKKGFLDVQDARTLFVPRGVAVARILQDYPEPSEAPHLMVCCRGGARSAMLAESLRELGYAATSVSNGATGCEKNGLTRKYDAQSADDQAALGAWSENLALAPSPLLARRIAELKSVIKATTAKELLEKTKARNGDTLIFDVRQPHESGSVQDARAIADAQRIEAGAFEKKARFHAQDFDQQVVIYSDADGDYRALIAAKNLMEMGYKNVSYLEGGYAAYERYIKLTARLP